MQISLVGGDKRQPLAEMVAPNRRGIAKVTQVKPRFGLQLRQVPLRQNRQRPHTLRRQRQEVQRPRGCHLVTTRREYSLVALPPCHLVTFPRCHKHMRIRPANAKGTNPGHP